MIFQKIMQLTDLNDTEIWSAFKKGEDRALSFIYSENSEKLYHYGLKFTADYTLVEDSIQELFTELIKNRRNIGNTDNILYYLLKSFKRKLIRNLKNKNRYDHSENYEGNKFEVVWSIEHDLILQEISEEKSGLLTKALKKLSYRQKEAIYLRFTRELDYKSIAGIMDISVEACRNLISKAITALKKSISGNGQGAVLLIYFLKPFAEASGQS
jgi:RNA polymerase sigma factor (sigma-70 family)